MIHTVTLNPAIDHTVGIENFRLDAVNRIATSRRDPGGKGLNVSKVIRSLGGTSCAHGFIGGDAGRWLQKSIISLGISTCFTSIAGETRTNLKVVDPVNQTHTDINEPGPQVGGTELESLQDALFSAMKSGDLLVLSGSVPRGVDSGIYARWIHRAREMGVKCLLDADGDLLRAGVAAGPDLLKPNIHELERLSGMKLDSRGAVVDAARALVAGGVGRVVVSLGADGAFFVEAGLAIHADGIRVEAKSTVGAGDSMLAAMAMALESGSALEGLVVPAVAAGTAAVVTEGSGACAPETVALYAAQVRYRAV